MVTPQPSESKARHGSFCRTWKDEGTLKGDAGRAPALRSRRDGSPGAFGGSDDSATNETEEASSRRCRSERIHPRGSTIAARCVLTFSRLTKTCGDAERALNSISHAAKITVLSQA